MRQRALITGITGQDGSYLAELLLSKGYEVYGMVRQAVIENPEHRLARLRNVLDRVRLYVASLENVPSIYNMVELIRPHECYHLAAQAYVSYSFADEFSILSSNINGTHYLLSALRKFAPTCRFCFAGSSEMFGEAGEAPQRETTGFHPRSLYGISKAAACELTRNYREACHMHACIGILFSHESPRRNSDSVTRKITTGIAAILAGKSEKLRLGNLKAQRDLGHARDYVEALWMMLQHPAPDDFVIATGEAHSVEQFAKLAFEHAGLDWRRHVEVEPTHTRSLKIDNPLIGDYAKARKILGWKPHTAFADLVVEMVEADCFDRGIRLPLRARAASTRC